MRTVLVTGSSGLIGSEVCIHFENIVYMVSIIIKEQSFLDHKVIPAGTKKG
jgi:FlaA1/EpsC-like NDP-sugar epimerase